MAGGIHEIQSCEVCGGTALELSLDLGLHPLCDDLLPIDSPDTCKEYPVEVLFCHGCRTAHQRFQVAKQVLFPADYHYRSRFTADVVIGMRSLAEATEFRLGSLRGKHVLDIGCNDGSLLDAFRNRGARTTGIEPTAAAIEAREHGHAIMQAYLTPPVADEIKASHGRPDVITFTNVFAHIDSLTEALHSLRRLMDDHTVLVIENHYLGAILDKCQFDTFYHEHPRTYSLTSFVHIAASLGRCILDVAFPSRYGGNIRVFIGPRTDNGAALNCVREAVESEAHFGERLHKMPAQVARWRERALARIGSLRKGGQLSCKAFPARAAILMKLLGLDSHDVEAVYEKPGSKKIGKRVPGTRIPICSDEDFFRVMEGKPSMLNLAWHISPEVRSYLRQCGYRGTIVDVCEPADLR